MPYDEDGVFVIPAIRAGAIGVQLYPHDEVSRETGLLCDPEEDLAQQQFKDEADINEIVRRFGLTGQMPDDVRVPVSGDFTGISDFQTALNAVTQAQEAFMDLPAEVRARFANDPQRLMEFVADGSNRDEAIKLGLVPKAAPPQRDMVMAIDELKAVLTPEKK